MVGAFVGDLAATTWKQDKKQFHKELITPNVFPSQLVKTILLTAERLVPLKDISQQHYRSDVTVDSPSSTILRAIAIGWLYDTEEDTYNAFLKHGQYNDKEDWYAGAFMAKLIFAMRNGASKKEATIVQHVSPFKTFYEDKYWQNKDGILGILVRAWEAFYKAFDFGSALHNAMNLPGNRHLNANIVGALADAMYGCETYRKKAKYGGGVVWLHPDFVPSKIKDLCKEKRVFFPKSSATINAEKHNWTYIKNPYENKVIFPELRRRILKAFRPTFDDRYGIYLDDSFFYIYRSGYILERFKLSLQKDGTYRITHLQSSEQNGLSNTAIDEALYSVEHRWNLVSRGY